MKPQVCRVCGHQGAPDDYDKCHPRLCKRCASDISVKRRLVKLSTEELHEYCDYHSHLIKLAQEELMGR